MSKNEISTQLKDISLSKVQKEWSKLKNIKLEELENLNGRNRLGCDFIDYYFGLCKPLYFDDQHQLEYKLILHYLELDFVRKIKTLWS